MAFLSSSLTFTPIRSTLRSARSLRSSVSGRPRVAAVRMTSKTPDPKTLTDADWRAKLSREEYNVLRQAGTERPGTGEYDNFYPKGEAYFACRGCGNPLYSGESKFKSGCGWPAFDKCYKDAVRTKVDNAFGMRRVEILCANCDGHLGHVFEGERFTETNERHCVNSLSLKYVEGKMDREEGKVV